MVTTREELEALPRDTIFREPGRRLSWVSHKRWDDRPNIRAAHLEALVKQLPLECTNHPDDRKTSMTAGQLAAHDAEVIEAALLVQREAIAAAIHAAKPKHITRDYTHADAAYDHAAHLARTFTTEDAG